MKRQLEVPIPVLIEVFDIFLEEGVAFTIDATDRYEETVTLEVEIGKDDRATWHQATDVVDDYKEDNEHNDEEEEDDD